jgi:hypothetical protein
MGMLVTPVTSVTYEESRFWPNSLSGVSTNTYYILNFMATSTHDEEQNEFSLHSNNPLDSMLKPCWARA